MPYFNDNILDSGVSYAQTNGTRIDICTAEPTTYTEATSTYTLGNKTGLTVGAPTDATPNGRKVVVPAITDGTGTGTGSGGYWALTNGSNILVAAGPLAAAQAITNGNPFTLEAIDISLADPTAV